MAEQHQKTAQRKLYETGSDHLHYMSKCKVKYMDLQGIIPCKSCDFEYHAYHILRLVIITAQIVEIAGFVILVN